MKLCLKVISAVTNYDRSLSATLDQIAGTIGRNEGNTLVLPDPKKWISGKHAMINFRASDYFIEDTSTNGILINQSPMNKGDCTKLNNGDQLQIGDYIIEVKMVQEPVKIETPEYGLSANNAFDVMSNPLQIFPDNPVDVMIKENDIWNNQPGRSNDPLDLSDLYPNKANVRDREIEIPPPLPQDVPFSPRSKSPVEEVLPRTPANTNSLLDDAGLSSSNNQKHISEVMQTPITSKKDSTQSNQLPPSDSLSEISGSGSQSELIKNFIKGVGLENRHLEEMLSPQSFYIIGRILRESIQGTQDVLNGRAEIKNEMHLDLTMINATNNNPIRLSASADEALMKLLSKQAKGYLEPEEAIKEAFDDIRAHQYAVISGMQAASLAIIKRFNPLHVEQRLQDFNPSSLSIPFLKQVKLWKLFTKIYQDIEQQANDNFYQLFGQAFAETYEEEEENIKKSRRLSD